MATNSVTNKIYTPIGIYRANITPIERLIKTTVGRQDLLDDLVEKLERNATKRGGQNYLFIGPRGVGKTHFLSLVENAVQQNEKLRNLYTIIRFPEENNRILSFADVLLGMINILAERDEAGEWRGLHNSLVEAERDDDIIDTIEPRIKRYRKETGKTFLLLIENLDTLFTKQLKKEQDIHRLRSFLMDSPCAALIGTSPIFFPGLYSNKSPFYDFFDITPLENLSEDDTVTLIRKNLEWEEKNNILEHFDEFLPKIYALHTMTSGNPRLTILLYELIAHDNLLEVKVQFQKLLDQISPFYQDRLKDLAPQERALLETIALMRDIPRTPAAIANRLRMKPQQVSSLLKRMTEARYLTVSENPKDKRSRVYRIKEGFFDLWLAMSESRVHHKRLSYLTQFFERYYRDRRDREQKRKELWEKLEKEIEQSKRNSQELLGYLSDLGDEDERCSSKIELAVHALKDGDAADAGELLKEVEFLRPRSAMLGWIAEKAKSWIKGENGSGLDVQKWLDTMVEYWKTQRSGDLEKAVEIAQDLAEDLSGKGLHKVRIELLNDALRNANRPAEKSSLLLGIAYGYKMQGKLSEALESLGQALSACQQAGDRSGEGSILNNISQIYDARRDYDTALKYLEEALKISRECSDRSGEGVILNNISQIYDARKDYDTALKILEKSLKISREIGNRSGESVTLNNIGQIYRRRENDDTALKYFEESLKLGRESGDRSGESATLNNIGQIYDARGDYDTSLKYFEESLKIIREIGDRPGEAITLNNIGHIYRGRGKSDIALKYLVEALMISRESGDRSDEGATLNNIGQIYRLQEDYDTALKYFEESLIINREIGDRTGEGATLNNIGAVYNIRKDYDPALKYFEESLKISREIGDRSGEAITLNNISQSYRAREDYATALKYLEESLNLRREIGDRSGEGLTLNNIGHIYRRREDYDTALKYFEESLKISREIGNRLGEAITLNNIGNIYRGREDYATALKYFEESLNLRRESGDRSGEAIMLNNIGQIYRRREDYDSALKYFEKSLKISREIDNRDEIAKALYNLGILELKGKNVDKAIALMMESWQIAIELKHAEALFYIGKRLGKIQVERGRRDDGLNILRIAYEAGKTAGYESANEVKALLEKLTSIEG